VCVCMYLSLYAYKFVCDTCMSGGLVAVEVLSPYSMTFSVHVCELEVFAMFAGRDCIVCVRVYVSLSLCIHTYT
jgi:hypothetical protein